MLQRKGNISLERWQFLHGRRKPLQEYFEHLDRYNNQIAETLRPGASTAGWSPGADEADQKGKI